MYVEYLMLTCLRVFLEDLLVQSVAFLFLALIFYSKFTQSPFIFINKIRFLELKICVKYLIEILKFLTESFFAEQFPPRLFVINIFETLCNPGRFRTRGTFRTLVYPKTWFIQSLKHIQNSVKHLRWSILQK